MFGSGLPNIIEAFSRMGFSKIFSFSVIRVTIAAKSAFVYTPFIQRIYWD